METLNEYCHLHLFKFLSPRDKLIFATVCPEWKEIMDNFFGISKLIMQDSSRSFYEQLETNTFLRIIRVLGSSFDEIDIQNYISTYRTSFIVHFDTYAFRITANFSIFLKSLSKHCKNLLSLKISNFCSYSNQHEVKDLIKCSKRLKKLEIGDNNFSGSHLKIELPSSIEQLVFRNISLTWGNDEDEPKKLPKLKSLMVWEDLHSKNYNFIQKLLDASKQLKALEIIETSLHSQSEFRQLTNLSKLINLEKLVLKCGNNSVTDKGIFEIALNCKKLQVIELDDCLKLTGPSVIVLLSSLPKLRCLKLRRLDAVKDIHLERIAFSMESLIVISCDKLCDLENAIAMMPNLKYLEVNNCFTSLPPILRIINVLISRNQNLEIIQRINCNDTQKIVVRMKNSVSLKVGERDKSDVGACSRDNVQTFKLAWIYTLGETIIDGTFVNPEMGFYFRPFLEINNEDPLLQYQVTRARIADFIKKIPTHEVLFEVVKAQARYW